MNGTHGLISQVEREKGSSKQSEKSKNNVGMHLAPVALWRKIEIKSSNIMKGEVLGQGAYSTVYRCLFQNKHAALKMFRNANEEKAFQEIEITFAMRHPNIIGIYAWLQNKGGTIPEIGMILEFADSGDLGEFYRENKGGKPYSYKAALKIVAGAAKGLAHMHAMPAPVVHRDVKSNNIMIASIGGGELVGKIADCGESRRVDLDSTMTKAGSPLWAAVSCRNGKVIRPFLNCKIATHSPAQTTFFPARAACWKALYRRRRHVLFWRRAL